MTNNSEYTHHIVIDQHVTKKEIREAVWTIQSQEIRVKFGDVIYESGADVRIPIGLTGANKDSMNSMTILEEITGNLRGKIGCTAPEMRLEKID